LCGALVSGCNSLAGTIDHVTINVSGAGDGTGTVVAPDPAVNIDCTSTASTETGTCTVGFDDAGGGGVFTLEATPLLPGSEFAGYTGGDCVISGADGTVCTLSFQAGESPTFNVTANFHLLAPAASDSVTFYNNSDVNAYYLVGPGETAGVSNRVASHASRGVLIPTAVGSQVVFRAYLVVGGAPVSTVTCQVTAAAWTDPLSPPLVVFSDGGGYFMTCSSGLVAL
jgi:hypothetical protein